MNLEQLPKHIILDTSESIKYLRSKVRNLSGCDADETEIMRSVFGSIVDENKANEELDYECLSIVSNYNSISYEADITIIVDAMVKFGDIMINDLKKLGAYCHGTLPYKYAGMLGDDVVLELLGA